MRRTPHNILRHELIGLRAKVVKSKNAYQVGLEGVVVDETMKTLLLETERGRKVVFKEDVELQLTLPDWTRVLVEGRELVGRPEDRLKKRLRDW